MTTVCMGGGFVIQVKESLVLLGCIVFTVALVVTQRPHLLRFLPALLFHQAPTRVPLRTLSLQQSPLKPFFLLQGLMCLLRVRA